MNKARKVLLLLLAVIISIALISCEKDEDPGNDNNDNEVNNNDNNDDNNDDDPAPLVFESLVAEKDTVEWGGATEITTEASGKDLTYSWSVPYGSIEGSGAQVIYHSSDPCVGDMYVTITCTVEDAYGETITKTIDIYVEM